MAEVIASTGQGEVLDGERRTIETYQLRGALDRRSTMRVVSGTGELHVDHYPSERPGGGESKGAVVFVHGLSGHCLMYAGFLDALSRRGFEVYGIDVRGHGRSSGPAGDFTMETVVQDLATGVELARDRGEERVALFGSSLGGYWSLAGANAIEDVDLCISHWVMLPDMPVTRLDRRMRPVAKVLSRLAPRMHRDTKTIANWDAVCDDPRLVEDVYADPMMTWQYTMRALASGIEYSPPRPLTDLRVPQLVLIGEEDGMTPLEYTRRVAERLRGELDLHVVPNAGHMGGLIEHRPEVLAVADHWLTSRFPLVEPRSAPGGTGAGREPAGVGTG